MRFGECLVKGQCLEIVQVSCSSNRGADLMGEMVDVVDSKNSPRRSAIEKAQAELRCIRLTIDELFRVFAIS